MEYAMSGSEQSAWQPVNKSDSVKLLSGLLQTRDLIDPGALSHDSTLGNGSSVMPIVAQETCCFFPTAARVTTLLVSSCWPEAFPMPFGMVGASNCSLDSLA